MAEETQTCKMCGVDFSENENFNWSCRTHRSEFSGELWWCCGKTNKEALGCKFGSHKARRDDDDDGLDLARDPTKNQKCKCCKEGGH